MREPEDKKDRREIALVACSCVMAFAGIFELAVVSPDDPSIALGTVLISALVATALTFAL
jgi:hypothetical protein